MRHYWLHMQKLDVPGLGLPKAASTLYWMRRPFAYMDRCVERFGEPFKVGLLGFPNFVMVHEPETPRASWARR